MHVRTGPGTRTDLDQEIPHPALLHDGEVLSVRRGHGRRERSVGVFALEGDVVRWMPVVDVDRRWRGSPWGPGGWVSLRGSQVRTWGLRLQPARRRPWWAHLLGEQPPDRPHLGRTEEAARVVTRQMTSMRTRGKESPLMPSQRAIGWGLLILAIGLATNSLLGPLALGVIEYHYSASMINQGIGLDAVTLLLAAPVSVVAGTLTLRGLRAGPILGLGPTAFAAYMVPQYVIGPAYHDLPGDNERFFPFHLALFGLGLALLLAAWASSAGKLPPDSPVADRRRTWLMGSVAAFILLRWAPVVAALVTGGDVGPAYRDNPTALLLVALLDLGLVVPAAVAVAIGLRRGASWARKGVYAVVGWFALVPVSVAAMAVTMQVRNDPDASPSSTLTLSIVALVFLVAAAGVYRPILPLGGVPDHATVPGPRGAAPESKSERRVSRASIPVA